MRKLLEIALIMATSITQVPHACVGHILQLSVKKSFQVARTLARVHKVVGHLYVCNMLSRVDKIACEGYVAPDRYFPVQRSVVMKQKELECNIAFSGSSSPHTLV